MSVLNNALSKQMSSSACKCMCLKSSQNPLALSVNGRIEYPDIGVLPFLESMKVHGPAFDNDCMSNTNSALQAP